MLPAGPVASTVLVGSNAGTLLVAVCVGAFAALLIGLLVGRHEPGPPEIDLDETKGDPGRTRLSA